MPKALFLAPVGGICTGIAQALALLHQPPEDRQPGQDPHADMKGAGREIRLHRWEALV